MSSISPENTLIGVFCYASVNAKRPQNMKSKTVSASSAVITNIYTMPVPKLRRRITPGRASTGNPKDSFEKATIVLCGNTTVGSFPWQ